MLRSAPVVILAVLVATRGAAADAPSQPSDAGDPSGEHVEAVREGQASPMDPITGLPRPVDGGTAAADTRAYAAEVDALKQRLRGADALNLDNLVDNVALYNQARMVDTRRAKAAFGWSPDGSSGLSTELTIGQVTDIDYPEAYPTQPEMVHFVTGGKNQLAGLDRSLKRASRWMNKHTCGGFNWTAQFKTAFRTQALAEYLQSLPEGIAAALPMALIGAFSPQLAEIVKHLKLITSFDISAAKADCHAIESALTSGLRKDMWGEAYSECLERYKAQGIREAMSACKSSTTAAVADNAGQLRNPNTTPASDAGWLSDAFSTTQDKLQELYARDAGTTAETAARGADTAAGNGSLTGSEKGLAEAYRDSARGPAASQQLMREGQGSAIESLGRSLWGSVRIHGSGALEVGRKSIRLFELRLSSHAASWRNSLRADLLEHYALLATPSRDPDDLRLSYDRLKQWTWQTRGADRGLPPWADEGAPNPEVWGRMRPADTIGNALSTERPSSGHVTQRVTDETMDACAYLLGLDRDYAGNLAVRTRLAHEYHVNEFLDALAWYELYLYLCQRFDEDYQHLMDLTRRTSQSGNGAARIEEQEQALFSEARTQLLAERRRHGWNVLGYLPAINAFRPYRFQQMYQPAGSSPTLSVPSPGFPSE